MIMWILWSSIPLKHTVSYGWNPQNTGSVYLCRQMNLKKRYSDADSRSCVLVASSQYLILHWSVFTSPCLSSSAPVARNSANMRVSSLQQVWKTCTNKFCWRWLKGSDDTLSLLTFHPLSKVQISLTVVRKIFCFKGDVSCFLLASYRHFIFLSSVLFLVYEEVYPHWNWEQGKKKPVWPVNNKF